MTTTLPPLVEAAAHAMVPLIREAAAVEDKGFMGDDAVLEATGHARRAALVQALSLVLEENEADTWAWLDSQP